MVTGGRADEAGPLGMKRELRALDADVLQLEHESSEAQAALAQVSTELREAEQSLEQITLQQRDAERSVFSATHRHEHMQSELARLGLELTVCQNELLRLRKDSEDARMRAEQREASARCCSHQPRRSRNRKHSPRRTTRATSKFRSYRAE